MLAGMRSAVRRTSRILQGRWWLILLPALVGALAGAASIDWTGRNPFGTADTARPPADPREPSREGVDAPAAAGSATPAHEEGPGTRIISWAVGGLALGLVLGAFLEYRCAPFDCEDEVTRILSLKVLAAVPVMEPAANRQRHRRRWALFGRRGLFAPLASAAASSVRMLLQ